MARLLAGLHQFEIGYMIILILALKATCVNVPSTVQCTVLGMYMYLISHPMTEDT